MMQTSRNNRFRSRSVLTATTASAATFGLVSSSQAQIVWSGALNQNVQTTGTLSMPLDFNLNNVADDPEAYLTLFSGGGGSGATFLLLQGNTSAKSDANAFLFAEADLTASQEISATSGLRFIGEHADDFLKSGTTTLVGFEYFNGGAHYGWAQITFNGDGVSGTLNQWAYNSQTGASIQAGQTGAMPEPSVCVTVAGIACAVFAARRRLAARPQTVRAQYPPECPQKWN